MESGHKQRGLTFLGWMVVLPIIGLLGLMAIRLAPLYYDYTIVKSVLDDVAYESEARRMNRSQVWDALYKQFYINNIKYIKEGDLKMERRGREFRILLDYEIRRHLIGNIGLVVRFDYQARAKKGDVD